MGRIIGRKLARKFCTLHGIPARNRRRIARVEARLPGDKRFELRQALRKDLRAGKLPAGQTHLARFLAANGL